MKFNRSDHCNSDISGHGGEEQGIWYGNSFQRHIPGVQQGQWW